jgi:membrane protease YdiL (CAAX protease family)
LTENNVSTAARRTPGEVETLLLALALVAAFHAVPSWVFAFLPRRQMYEALGEQGYGTLYDTATGVLPLLLCLGAPLRCGFRLGVWKDRTLKVLGVCVLPVILTGIIYPLTSRPFSGYPIGCWLVSPAAQDLLFTGYLYGLLDVAFPGPIHRRVRVNRAVLITAVFFALWHVPNFFGISTAYVCFQLLYTAIGGAWVLLARQMTGSILPGIATHMAVNFIAWL